VEAPHPHTGFLKGKGSLCSPVMKSKDKIKVRQAQTEDLEFLVENNRQLALETESKELDRNFLRQGVQWALAHTDSCIYFVAEIEGKPVGQTMITFEWSDLRDGWIWWLQSVYVLPNYRNRGIFRMMFKHIKSSAHKGKNVRGLKLYIKGTNFSGISVYDKLGMISAGYMVYEEEW